jgi:hypothetical protein
MKMLASVAGICAIMLAREKSNHPRFANVVFTRCKR